MSNEVRTKSLICFEWIVQDPGSGIPLYSKPFSFLDRKCHLEFFIQTSTNSSYLYFKCESELESRVYITTRVATDSGTLRVKPGSIRTVHQDIWTHSGRDLRNVLLTVQVIIHADLFKEDKSVQTPSYKDGCFSVEDISRDFGRLLEKGPSHDVELLCVDQTVKAHKNIISRRSSVLGSKLQSDMVEGETGPVSIEDFDDAEIFHEFVTYVYTGKHPELTFDSAFKLYEVSNIYGLDVMKQKCADFLTDNLTPENVLEVLVFADRHSDENFKTNVMEVVIKLRIPYMQRKWADFCFEHELLAQDILKLLSMQRHPN